MVFTPLQYMYMYMYCSGMVMYMYIRCVFLEGVFLYYIIIIINLLQLSHKLLKCFFGDGIE